MEAKQIISTGDAVIRRLYSPNIDDMSFVRSVAEGDNDTEILHAVHLRIYDTAASKEVSQDDPTLKRVLDSIKERANRILQASKGPVEVEKTPKLAATKRTNKT